MWSSLPLSVTLISRVPFYFHAHKFTCLLPTLFERKMLSHFGRKWAGKKTNKMKMKEREKRCGLDFRNHYGFRLHSFVLVQTNGPQQIYTTRKQIQKHTPTIGDQHTNQKSNIIKIIMTIGVKIAKLLFLSCCWLVIILSCKFFSFSFWKIRGNS